VKALGEREDGLPKIRHLPIFRHNFIGNFRQLNPYSFISFT